MIGGHSGFGEAICETLAAVGATVCIAARRRELVDTVASRVGGYGFTCDITDDEIRRITQGPDAPGWSPLESALLRAADELHADAFVSDATWSALKAHYTTEQLIDLVFTVGQYNLVSMALNTLGVQLDDGIAGFPG